MKAVILLCAHGNGISALRPYSTRWIMPGNIKALSQAGTARHVRWQSKNATTPATKADPFPELLNVYRAGSTADLAVGFGRMLTIGFFIYGTTLVAPPIYFDPNITNWWIPMIVLGSATPMVATALGSTPLVHDIKVKLPDWARKSRQELLNFSRNVPPETVVRASFMRWAPWPRTEEMLFRDLRRVTQGTNAGRKGGLANRANLEWHAPTTRNESEKPTDRQVTTRYRLFVKRDQKKDMSASPGLWDIMWPQISELTADGSTRSSRPTPRLPRSKEVHPALRKSAVR